MTRDRDLRTIKIPRTTTADPDAILQDDWTFDSDVYREDAIHGYELHRQRKDVLGVTWLEYLNEQAPLLELLDAPEMDVDIADVARRVADDLESDVREAAYQGAREALRER